MSLLDRYILRRFAASYLMLGASISYVSTTKNCPWGQNMLRRMTLLEKDKIEKFAGGQN